MRTDFYKLMGGYSLTDQTVFRRRIPGSTTTEMGLIASVVLVTTIGLWFLLGNGLKQAMGMVKSDMLAQVSNANGTTAAVYEPPPPLPPPVLDDPLPEPVEPTPTVVTVGSNGNEWHPETYKALEALINRALQKGTMKEAQADLLRQLIAQILLFNDLHNVFVDSYVECDYVVCDFDVLSTKQVEFRGETFMLTDLMKRLGKTLTPSEYPELEGPYGFYDSDALYEKSEGTIAEKLFSEAETKGVLDDPEIFDFVMTVKSQ
ncbi:hypothetical protein [Vampirovibrio chlorellavorus]|uniref:hypothetical protein n=1 Tax=Vampirovibrio chlorellavorus TaxID=758823 RepID=UPI0026EFFBAE|nr:hypothetical protein [Vampirovibrio chlorellavorus]